MTKSIIQDIFFFYINYLIEQNQFNKAKEITDQIDILNNSLLIAQTKNWIDKKEFEKFNQIFSCKNETDILGEFFFFNCKHIFI